MKEPAPPTVKPAATPDTRQPIHPEVRRPDGPQHRVRVRFYRRMRVQRLYPMVVEVEQLADHRPVAKTPTGAVRVRPVIPGAQVTPAEQDVDVGQRGPKATFAVTPLACGALRDARLEVYQHGRLLQQVALPMQGSQQRLTWVLLFATVLVPALVYYLFSYVNLTRAAPPPPLPPSVRDDWRPDEPMAMAAEEGQAGPPARFVPAGGSPPAAGGMQNMARRGGRPGAGGPPRRGAGPAAGGLSGRGGRPGAGGPPAAGVVAADKEQAPAADTDSPKLDGKVERAIVANVPSVPFLPHLTRDLAISVQDGYEGLYYARLEGLPLVFYTGLLLLALTVVSWITHAGKRSRRRGKPVALGA
jgi:hypothetical protein